jgi:predicted MFS family arabinose efflux permease
VANQSNTSGAILADKLGWVSFFMVTTVATIPSLALLVWLARRSAAPSDQPLPLFTSAKR